MSENTRLKAVTTSVANEAKRILGQKLDAVVLYGSYARGNYDEESDIDIMVRIRCTRDELMEFFYIFSDIGSRISLENDVTVSILIYDTETFNRYKSVMPFLVNVEKEGVKVA